MKKYLVVLAAVLVMSNTSMSYAGAVLHLGSPPNAGTYLWNGEVLPFDDTSLGILENGNGQPALVDPLLLIMGVPNVTSANYVAPSASISYNSTGTGPGTINVGGANVFGGSWNTSTGYAGNFTSAFQGDVYSFIGLQGGNGSNNWSNWYGADYDVNGIQATGFGIFVYTLNGINMSGGESIDIEFLGPLNVGTYAIAYGKSNDTSKKSYFSTPFTEAGMTTQVPEPSSLLLLGAGLLGLGMFRRKI